MTIVFLFLYWFLIYLENPKESFKLKQLVFFVPSLFLGFATLLLVPALCAFFLIELLWIDRVLWKRKIQDNLKIALVMGVVSAIVYLHMKQLAVYQIAGNQDVYGSQGFVKDLRIIFWAFIGAYSRLFFLIALFSSVAACYLSKESIAFKVNIFFLVLVAIILTTKLIGIYPVFSAKHVVWIVPISIFVMVSVSTEFLKAGKNTYIILCLMSLLILSSVRNIVKLANGKIAESSNNNALYSELANYAPSHVVVYGSALSSYYVYKRLIPSLQKHHYYGIWYRKSEEARPNVVSMTEWQLGQLPDKKSFLIVLSNVVSDTLEDPGLSILRKTLDKNNCIYKWFSKRNLENFQKN